MHVERRPAALISQMDPPPGEREEFDSWYALEHVPARMRIPGFEYAVRGWAVQGEPSHLVVYHLRSLEVLETTEYVELKTEPSEQTAYMLANVAAFTRFTAEEIGDTGTSAAARYLYLVTFPVPPEAQREFDEWYAEDHVPALMKCRDWLRVRRYAVHDAVPAEVTRAAVHELASLAALDSPERVAARASDWRAALAENDWFKGVRYAVYKQFQEFAAAR